MGRGTLRTLAAIGIAVALFARDVVVAAKENVDVSTSEGLLSLVVTGALAALVNWLVSKFPRSDTPSPTDDTTTRSTGGTTGRTG